MTDSFPPYCPEAEQGVLGCCLLDINKAALALKAGVNRRWFFDARHVEVFNVLSSMVGNGGGDALVATLLLRERGLLDQIGGPAYLNELQNAVPSAENLAVETLAVTSGAAVAMAGHFAKGNAAGKETIDRISGSGVFARDPDSIITFTKHEEEGAFTVEMVLRNLPPVAPFVVSWQWPLFQREESLDPAKLKQAGGRPTTHSPQTLLECLGDQRLTTTQWKKIAREEKGVSATRFFHHLKSLAEAGKVSKSAVDSKWEKIRHYSRNYNSTNDQ